MRCTVSDVPGKVNVPPRVESLMCCSFGAECSCSSYKSRILKLVTRAGPAIDSEKGRVPSSGQSAINRSKGVLMRKTAWFVLAVCLALPCFAEDDTGTAVIKSIGSKGAEVATKALAGLLYDTSCKGVNADVATGYICKVLGSVSGRTEDAWKA